MQIEDYLEGLMEGFVAYDRHWRMTYMNAAAERILGRRRADVLGKTWHQAFPHALGNPVDRMYQRVMRTREGERMELFYDHYGRWFEISASPAQTGGVAVYFRDVSDRVRAKDELSSQVSSLTKLHELAVQLGGSADLDEMLRATLETMAYLHGTSRGLLSLYDASAGALEVMASLGMDEATLERVRRVTPGPNAGACGSAFALRKRVVVEDTESDRCFLLYREVARAAGFRAVHSTPIVNRAGDILGVVSVHFDEPRRPSQTEMQLADMCARYAADAIESTRHQRALRQSEQRFRSLLGLLPVAVYTCEAPSGRITYYNDHAARLWGRTPALGDSEERFCACYKVFLPDGAFVPREQTPMAVALRDGASFRDLEAVVERPDGGRFFAVVNIDPIRDVAGNIVGAINVFYDVSERRRVQESLREADRRKDEFIAMLSHELRNPLAPLKNALELLRLKEGSDPDGQLRGMMERQVGQLVRLVDDLLEVSRINRGLLELRAEPVQLAQVLRNALETAEPLIREAGHRLEVLLPPEPLWVLADPVRLAQSFANLLNNAARYTPRGGHISVGARQGPGDTVLAWVRDSGAGFSRDVAARLFEMFARGENSQGLGVGLALVRKLVEMHGGKVEARSDGPGRGAEFTVTLPATAPGVPARPFAHAPEALPPVRVLVADDNHDAAHSLAMLLRSLGSEVAIARDGMEAIEAARAFRPQLVLLDIGMPRLDGYGAARELRRDPQAGQVRIVALTGWGQEEDRRRAREAGFDGHLVKPAELDALRRVLSEVGRETLH